MELERRLFMSVGVDHDYVDENGQEICALPLSEVADQLVNYAAGGGSSGGGTVVTTSVLAPLTDVPALSSLPGVYAKLYLDFNGDAQAGNTPAYDNDGDYTTFSEAELDAITEIWRRVSEKYSPFNISVTTVDPGNLNNGETLRVLVGGTGSWYGAYYGGVAPIGAFTSTYDNLGGKPNTVYAFSDNFANNDRQNIAEVCAHEAGHGFGLQHQSAYNSSGQKTAEYYYAGQVKSPIMGISYSTQRGTWWLGTSSAGATSIQDDLSIISNSTNAFGYRPDDHYDVFSLADPLAFDGTTGAVSGSGVIEQTTDRDLFYFDTAAGIISLSVNTVLGPTLDAKLNVYRAIGGGNYALVASASTSSLSESVAFEAFTPGTYMLSVESQGAYADIGQYTLGGTIIPTGTAAVLAPTGLVATVNNGAVGLTWTDAASNEDGYVVERSSDGGASWQLLASTAANQQTLTDSTTSANSTYYYRVYATSGANNSGYSNIEGVSTPPVAPAGLTATVLSYTSVQLGWSDVAGETQYKVERSATGTSGWALVGTTGANVTSYVDTVAPNATYYYRVIAVSGAGRSPASNVVTATTPYLAPPGVPTGFTVTDVTFYYGTLVWNDLPTETGYNVQRSTDGINWTDVVTSISQDSTTYTVYVGPPDSVASFRIRGFNPGGNSAWTDPLSVQTLPNAVPEAPSDAVATFSGDAVVIDFQGPENAQEWILEQLMPDPYGDDPYWEEVSRSDEWEVSFSGLENNSFYQFRVRASNELGVSEPTEVFSGWTGPATTTMSATIVSPTQVNLAWADVDGESEYGVFRYQVGSSAGYVEIATLGAGVTSLSDTVEPSSQYYYYIISRNSRGTSSWYSNFVVITTSAVLLPPANVTAVASNSTYRVTVSWTDAAVETGYKIQRSTDGGTSWSQIGTVSADVVSYQDSNVTVGNTYRYRVTSTSGTGDSAVSAVAVATVTAITTPAAPTNLRQTGGSAGSITLAWDDVSNNEVEFVIERYQLDWQYQEDMEWVELGRTTDTTFTETEFYPWGPKQAPYRVRAVNVAGSASSAQIDAKPAPSTVTIYTIASPTPTTVTLNWSDAGVSDSWLVQRSLTGVSGSWSTVGSGGSGFYTMTDTGLSPSTLYYYRVIGSNVWGQAASAAASITTLVMALPAAPSSLVISGYTPTDGAYYGVGVQWTDNASTEAGFVIDRAVLGSENWAALATVGENVTAYVDATAAYGTAYSYRVRAFNAGGASANTTQVNGVIPTPAAVSNLNAISSTAMLVTLFWTDVISETGYTLQRSTDGGVNWWSLGTAGQNVTTYADTTVVGGTSYAYRVFAANTGGNASASNVATVVTIPSAPASLSATANGANAVNLSWANVAGETGYRVELSTTGTSGWAEIATPAANVLTYGATGLLPITTYYFRVRATNASGDSAYSPTASAQTANAIPPAPSGLSVTGVTTTTASLAWTDNSNNETLFKIERSTNGTSWTQIATVSSNVTSYTATGLNKSRTYYFRVRSYNTLGNSAYSSVVTAQLPAALTSPLVPVGAFTLVSAGMSDTSLSNVSEPSSLLFSDTLILA